MYKEYVQTVNKFDELLQLFLCAHTSTISFQYLSIDEVFFAAQTTPISLQSVSSTSR